MSHNIKQYCSPSSLEQLWEILEKLTDTPVFLAGGTELLRGSQGSSEPSDVWVSLGQIPELVGIHEREESLFLGAASTCTHLAESDLIQCYGSALAEAAREFGTWQIRNRCSIGGLVSRGGVESDIVPTLYALNAKIVCSNGQEERVLECEDFFLGPTQTACQDNEIILGIELPKTQRHSIFLKRSAASPRHPAKVSVAIAASFDDNQFKQVRIAIGAAGPMVQRVTTAEGLLEGQPVDYLPLLERVAYEVRRAARPASDVISNARYRKWSVGILTLQALHQLVQNYNLVQAVPEAMPVELEPQPALVDS